jgi:hypothetical protein
MQTHDTLADIEGATWEADSATAIQVSALATEAGSHVNYGKTQVLTFTSVATGQRCKGIIIYHSSGTRAASALLAYDTFTSAVTSDGGQLQVTLNASGWGRGSI